MSIYSYLGTLISLKRLMMKKNIYFTKQMFIFQQMNEENLEKKNSLDVSSPMKRRLEATEMWF